MIALTAYAGSMDGSRMMKGLTNKLDLTTEQQAQVKQIFEAKRPQMEALHQQMKALRDETDTEIKAILTTDQLKKFEEMQAKRKEKREHFMEHHKNKERD